MTQEPRRMLAPWTVEEGDSTYLVRTTNGFVVSVTYWDDSSRFRYGNNHINIAFDQFSGEAPIPIRLFGGKSMQEHNVLAFNITKITEGLGQDTQIDLLFFRAARVPKHADLRHFCALLRVRDQRPNS